MSYRWITAGVIAVIALAAGCLAYICFHRPFPDSSAHAHDSLAWVREEFKLPPEKMARVEAMHESYELVCADHCTAIADSRKELKRLRDSNAPAAEIDAAMTRVVSVDAQCIASTQKHIREIAAIIGGEDGRRYLSIVLPRVASFDHSAPATLDMQKSSAHDSPRRK
jgi:hypothetical protein